MSKTLFHLTGDTHLRQRTWIKHLNLWGDSLFSLQQILEESVGQPLILAGDVYDQKRPDPQTVRQVYWLLDQAQHQGVDVYYIQGQHDLDRECPWLACHPHPRHLHKCLVDINGVAVYGLDWLPPTEIKQALQEIPRDAEVLVAHQVWGELLPWGVECSFADVPTSVQLVCTGDYHVHLRGVQSSTGFTQLATERLGPSTDDSVYVLSPGSTCMQSVSESPDKFFYHVSRENGTWVAESRPLKTRPFIEATITDEQHAQQFVTTELPQRLQAAWDAARVPRHIRTPMVRVRYDTRLSLPYEALEQTVQRYGGHLFPDLQTSKEVVEIPRGDETQFTTWQQGLDELQLPDDVRALALHLLTVANDETSDVAEELQRLYSQYLEHGTLSCS